MVEITAQMVKELREKTGGGIALCKEALQACNGNYEDAALYIRKKDKDKAAKKAERATGEGVVFVRLGAGGRVASLAEIACETDFVAKNDRFQALGNEILDAVEKAPSLGNPAALALASGKNAADAVSEAIATIGENMKLRRVARLHAPEQGVLGLYRHFNQKAASVVALTLEKVDPQSDAVRTLTGDLCMHITSCRPAGLTRADIPEKVLAREKEVFAEEVKGKPAEIQEKILDGKLAKFLASVCLAEQPFVKDDKVKVGEHVNRTLKAAGGSGTIAGFVRFELGGTAVAVRGELGSAES